MKPRRVVITGLGALTPIGNTLPDYWEGLLSGTSGAAPISYFDPTLFKTQFACELKNFDPLDQNQPSLFLWLQQQQNFSLTRF